MGVHMGGGALSLLEAREGLRRTLAGAVSFLGWPGGPVQILSCMPSGAYPGPSFPTCTWALRPQSGGSAPPTAMVSGCL